MADPVVVEFFGGMDDTHNPRRLPYATGVRCENLDLRFGRFEVRKDLFNILAAEIGALTVQSPTQLAFSCYSTNGEQLLFVATGDGKLKVVRGITFETGATYPSYTSVDDVIDRNPGVAALMQTSEPMEAVRFGDFIYISNAGGFTNEYAWSTFKLDLRDLKGDFLLEADWPKSRHIENYLGYAVLGDLSSRSPRTILSSDRPLIAGTPTWAAGLFDEPGTDPDDRVMRLIYNGQYLLAFFKRSLWRYTGAPTHWIRNQLLDIGTLAPKSVEFLGGNVYFLGNDGIPRRTNGREMVAEKVGAFDYEGKLKHVDGRSPIEVGLREYLLGSGSAGGSEATFRWDSQTAFNQDCVADIVTPPGFANYSEYVAGAGIRPERVAQRQEGNWPSYVDVHAILPTEQQYLGGGYDFWQSWRLATVAEATGSPDGETSRIQHTHLRHAVAVKLFFYETGMHTIKARLYDHTSDVAASLNLTELDAAEVDYNVTSIGTHEVTIVFDDVRVEDEINVLGPDPPLNSAKYRVVITRDGGGQVGWHYDRDTNPYARGRAGGSGGGGSVDLDDDFVFRYFAYRYERRHGSHWDDWATARLKSASAVVRGGRPWRDVTFVKHEDSDHVELKVYLTATLNDPPSWGDFVEVPSSGIPIQSLFETPPDNLRWMVAMEQDAGWGGDCATLESIAISLNRIEPYGRDDPAALAWDGRYCLSLKRRNSYQRDIYVWDREAWSKWTNVGFDHAAVMYDAVNRQRLVTIDAFPDVSEPTRRAVCAFLEDRRNTWRANLPKSQTSCLLMAGLRAAQVRKFWIEYTEVEGSVAGAKLLLHWRVDSGPWIEHNITLKGDFRQHVSVREVAANEGRVIELLVGENPLEPLAVQCPVIIDRILAEVVEIGDREGFHDGGA